MSHDTAPGHDEFPTAVTFASATESYHAAYGLSLSSFLAPLLAWLGNEVNESALMSTAVPAALTSFGNKAAILSAIIANAPAIFTDPITRPWIVKALTALKDGFVAKAAHTLLTG